MQQYANEVGEYGLHYYIGETQGKCRTKPGKKEVSTSGLMGEWVEHRTSDQMIGVQSQL